jgi:predicted hydrocarbon binding protein
VSDRDDFERAWLDKLCRGLREVAGDETCRAVVEGCEELSSESPRRAVIAWTAQAMRRLVSMVGVQNGRTIMTGCACQYPRSALEDIRRAYEATGNIDVAHRMLQERFRSFLTDSLGLRDELIEEIIGRGWGLAGVRDGDGITAIKIPKSGNLVEYMEETDPERRRQLYCHCPRIRDVLKTADSELSGVIAETYCYCGAGFYKGIWEEILQAQVGVEVAESVLRGDDVCKIVVSLPAGSAREPGEGASARAGEQAGAD